jgi:hypothetical protein
MISFMAAEDIEEFWSEIRPPRPEPVAKEPSGLTEEAKSPFSAEDIELGRRALTRLRNVSPSPEVSELERLMAQQFWIATMTSEEAMVSYLNTPGARAAFGHSADEPIERILQELTEAGIRIADPLSPRLQEIREAWLRGDNPLVDLTEEIEVLGRQIRAGLGVPESAIGVQNREQGRSPIRFEFETAQTTSQRSRPIRHIDVAALMNALSDLGVTGRATLSERPDGGTTISIIIQHAPNAEHYFYTSTQNTTRGLEINIEFPPEEPRYHP